MINKMDNQPKHLPGRDTYILPLLSLTTIMLLLIGSELAARHYFFGQEVDSCQVKDARLGSRFLPNCTSRTKTDEGPWVTNHYNECGYRTNESCGPKPLNTIRIALIGSSVAQGWSAPYEQTFPARAAAELTSRCRKPVEVQNLGRENCSVVCMFRRTDEALALKPDVLLLAISPFDIETTVPIDVQHRYEPLRPGPSIAEGRQNRMLIKRIEKIITGSRTIVAIEHFIFQDPSTYLKMYMAYGDKADFLRPPLTSLWEQRLSNVDLLIGEMAEKAHSEGVKMVVIEVPNLPQVSALALPKSTPAIDPFLLNERLKIIASHHRVDFVDVLPTFMDTPGSNRLFYLTAGHLDGDGYALVSEVLVENLTKEETSALSSCSGNTRMSSDALSLESNATTGH